jgi:nitroreductase
LPDYAGLVGALGKRRSIRSFADKPVPRELLDKLMYAARLYPTGHNLQEVDWLIIESRELMDSLCARTTSILGRTARLLMNPLVGVYLGLTEGFDKVAAGKTAAAALAKLEKLRLEGRDPIFYRAPLLLVAHVPSGTYFGRDDAVHAVYNVELAAERLGLGTCLMGYFKIALDRDKGFKKAIGLGADRSPEAAVVIGYPVVEYLRMLPRRKPELLWFPRSFPKNEARIAAKPTGG